MTTKASQSQVHKWTWPKTKRQAAWAVNGGTQVVELSKPFVAQKIMNESQML